MAKQLYNPVREMHIQLASGYISRVIKRNRIQSIVEFKNKKQQCQHNTSKSILDYLLYWQYLSILEFKNKKQQCKHNTSKSILDYLLYWQYLSSTID